MTLVPSRLARFELLAWLEALPPSGPRELDLSHSRLDPLLLRRLLLLPWAQDLVTLRLTGCFLGSDGVRVLAQAMPPRLQVLDLAGVARNSGPAGLAFQAPPGKVVGLLAPDAVQRLAENLTPGLRSLNLCSDGIDDADLAALAFAPQAASLQALWLLGSPFSTAGLFALVDSPHLGGDLDLWLDRPRDPAAETLLKERYRKVRFHDYPRAPRYLVRRK